MQPKQDENQDKREQKQENNLQQEPGSPGQEAGEKKQQLRQISDNIQKEGQKPEEQAKQDLIDCDLKEEKHLEEGNQVDEKIEIAQQNVSELKQKEQGGQEQAQNKQAQKEEDNDQFDGNLPLVTHQTLQEEQQKSQIHSQAQWASSIIQKDCQQSIPPQNQALSKDNKDELDNYISESINNYSKQAEQSNEGQQINNQKPIQIPVAQKTEQETKKIQNNNDDDQQFGDFDEGHDTIEQPITTEKIEQKADDNFSEEVRGFISSLPDYSSLVALN